MGMDELTKKKLWDDYRRLNSEAAREKLILEYIPLVKVVAGRLSMYLGYSVEYEDLCSYGIFGLIDAIDIENISAKTQDGVLTLTLPKSDRAKVHRITVE